MKTIKIIILVICLVLLISCKSNSPTSPSNPTTTSIYQTQITGLTHIEVMSWGWENWNSDIQKDGFRVTIYFQNNSDTNLNFQNINCRVRIRLFAYKKTQYYREDNRRRVYSKMFTFNNSNVGNIWNSPLRVWGNDINVNPQTDYWCGDIEVTVITPEQGEFSDSYEYCRLYPE